MIRLKRLTDGLARRAAKLAFKAFPLVDRLGAKDAALVVFSQPGERFSDNARAFFEYLTAADGFFRPVWLANNPAQKSKVEAVVSGSSVILARSLAGYRIALRARTFVVSHGLTDLAPYHPGSRRKEVVMLWHATSFKKTSVLHNGWSSATIEHHLNSIARRYTMMTASSEIDRYAKSASHGVDVRNVVVTGLPRNDKLWGQAAGREHLPSPLREALQAKTILYAPTWREGADTRFFPFADFDPAALNTYLTGADAYVLLRPHQNDAVNRARAAEWTEIGLDRLVLATSDVIDDVADILPDVDVVVTDFSSIYLDLLLTDRPSIFIPYDFDDYTRNRGLLYDYDLVTPGPKVSTQPDLIAALDSALRGAPDHAEHRALTRRMFHAFVDPHASRRVAEHLKARVTAPGI